MFRWLSSLFGSNFTKMDFSGVKKGIEENSVILIDVRNPDEVRNLGKIPGSHNLPLPQLKDILQLSENDFSTKFGFSKPTPNDSDIVIHCMRGARAATGDSIFKSLGYNNTKVYSGSFMDWVAQGGIVEK